jgi:hypothetical protein
MTKEIEIFHSGDLRFEIAKRRIGSSLTAPTAANRFGSPERSTLRLNKIPH